MLLVTNVADLSAAQIVERYKSLADIERGFKVLKSGIEIASVFHRLPERIRPHAIICFMALILYRVRRQRLKAAGYSASPETALAQCAGSNAKACRSTRACRSPASPPSTATRQACWLP